MTFLVRLFRTLATCTALLPSILLLREGGLAAPPVSLSNITTGTAKEINCKPGPWGSITCRYIYLEAPDELVAILAVPGTKPKWFFPSWDKPKLRMLFHTAGLTEQVVDLLLDDLRCRTENGVLVIYPPAEEVEALTSQQRAIIYGELAQSPLNEFHKDPVHINSGDAEEWFRHSELTPDEVKRFSRLCYRRGESLLFSDVALFLSNAASQNDARRLIKAITRTRTLTAQIEVSSREEASRILPYWLSGGKNKHARPMLESLAETHGPSARLDIVHLLPPEPRKLLYTYPVLEMSAHNRLPDCHWSSLNFFNPIPNPDFLDARRATAEVLQHYDKTSPPYELGDVLVFLDRKGDAFHSCVVVADDLVYTKNGENALAPWTLMKLEDVTRIYRINQLGVQGYRLKKTEPAMQTMR